MTFENHTQLKIYSCCLVMFGTDISDQSCTAQQFAIWATIWVHFASPPSTTSKELIKVPACTTYSKIHRTYSPPFPKVSAIIPPFLAAFFLRVTQLAQILDREKRQWYKCCRQFSPKFKCLLAARRKLRFSGCWAKPKKTQGGPPNIKKKWVIFDMFFPHLPGEGC